MKALVCCGAAHLALAALLTVGACTGAGGAEAGSREPAVSVTTGAQAPPSAARAAAAPAQLARVQFRVEGMTCAGCVIGTRAALKKLDGVQDADASYENSSAWASYDPAKVTPERMIAAIAELGYRATVVQS